MELIKQEIKKSLSNFDIKKMLKGKCNLISYDQLAKYKTIDEAMGKYGCLVILYETKEHYGHWTCVFKTHNSKGEEIISFFDSYALPVDKELDFIDDDFKIYNNSYYPYLSKLLFESPLKIEYNEHELQDFSTKISTCGRWVVARLIFRDLPLKKFVKLFSSDPYITSDELVTAFTMTLK